MMCSEEYINLIVSNHFTKNTYTILCKYTQFYVTVSPQ